MAIRHKGGLAVRLIFAAGLLMSAVASPSEAHGQNIFQKLIGKEKVESERHASESKKQNKHKEKNHAPQLNAMELSLDDNVAGPEVPLKQKESIKSHMTALAKTFAKRKTAKVETMREGEVVVATIATDLLFAPNDTVLMARGEKLLKPYSDELKSRNPNHYKVLLVVHTDDTGSDEYTDWLSEARVAAVMDMFADASATIVPYALGATEPRVPNNSRANRSSNRRLEIFIVPEQALIDLAKSNKLNSK